MHQQLLKKIDEIKNQLRGLDDDGATQASLDSIYDKLVELEDLIYDDFGNREGDEETEYYE